MNGPDDLQSRRLEAVRAWTTFVEQGDTTTVRPEILRSWELSGAALTPDVTEAPLADEGETAAYFQGSPLQLAVERVEDDLRRTAEDGDLVLAITDAETRILWTYGGRVMRRKAETVNFVPAGRWDEASVGTNALAIAGRTGDPSMVFSAEHFASIVHNWVCWAAPAPRPGLGRADRRHRPLHHLGPHPPDRAGHRPGAGAADRGRDAPVATVGRRVAGDLAPPEPGLSLSLLGTAEAWLDGQRLLLNRRQTEILALLCLHPEGLSLERLHALVYGDQAVTLSTLKAEVSHLRAAVGGQLASRPYRLMMPVRTDVEDVLALLGAGDVKAAVAAYGGDLLPGTNAPALAELGDYLAVSMREALLADPDPAAVLRYGELAPHDTEVVERCLLVLGEREHPAKALLKGRLAASAR